MNRFRLQAEQGFTLTELVIVIALLPAQGGFPESGF